MADLAAPELPVIIQIGVSVAVAIGGAVAIIFAYLRQFGAKSGVLPGNLPGLLKTSGEDVLIHGASIADLRPLRRAVEELERLRIAVEDIRDLMKREATIDDLARDAEAALDRAARRRGDEVDRERRGR